MADDAKGPERGKEAGREALRLLSERDCDAWIDWHGIVNEKGEAMDWTWHQFQIDIFNDQSDYLCTMKPAQVGLSTLEILKNFRDAERLKMDIIYTLPTDSDVTVFVGGKVNRIIQNNPHLSTLTKDKDSVEQKRVGRSMVYFRGTWSKKAAIMVTADRLVHDEIDSSKLDVIEDYQARLQHSKYRQTHVFSHPSAPGAGVDRYWRMSDQKEWFVRCPECGKEQFMEWNLEDPARMSVDIDGERYRCRHCDATLSDRDRAVGRWIPRKSRKRHPEVKWSGYHVSLLMAPWVSAATVCGKWRDVVEGRQTEDFFHNKVLGLPYAGSGNVVTEDQVKGAWTAEPNAFDRRDRIVVGVDSGKVLHYVAGNRQGLVGYGILKDWSPDRLNGLPQNETVEWFLRRFPDCVVVADAGGDIIGVRKLAAAYPGRVFLCTYRQDRDSDEIATWGKGADAARVKADRTRAIELVRSEMVQRRFRLYGGKAAEAWHDYWLHWSHVYRVWGDEDRLGTARATWRRADRDDWVHATVYWRIGLLRFGRSGGIIAPERAGKRSTSYMMNPDGTASFDPASILGPPEGSETPWWEDDGDGDWRDT